jgi:serine/threonine protein kinase
VKLTDFGTSRFISDDATTITKNVGTIAFMAPEALGHKPRINKSADVYSFAVLMWSVLFEQTPFKEFKWDSDIEQHVKSGRLLATRVDKSTYNGRASATTVFLRMKQ